LFFVVYYSIDALMSKTVLFLSMMMRRRMTPQRHLWFLKKSAAWRAVKMAIHSHSQYSNLDQRINFVAVARGGV
jgi:hypothetical protein